MPLFSQSDWELNSTFRRTSCLIRVYQTDSHREKWCALVRLNHISSLDSTEGHASCEMNMQSQTWWSVPTASKFCLSSDRGLFACTFFLLNVISFSRSRESSLLVKLLALGLSPLAVVPVKELAGVLMSEDYAFLSPPRGVLTERSTFFGYSNCLFSSSTDILLGSPI